MARFWRKLHGSVTKPSLPPHPPALTFPSHVAQHAAYTTWYAPSQGPLPRPGMMKGHSDDETDDHKQCWW